ncbi:MAG: methylglyoxal synthase [Spirochaetae bacterium HGW-Spirochaetae-1]|jgi:methylglyoxal synthase|nr:MAG: methylglyoxal synthase [Spirochaetae bacterium HGW-Spirochaetae-1]
MDRIKNIALVAHDNRKKDMVEWVEWNYKGLMKHRIVCTGTTGKLVEEAMKRKCKEDGIEYNLHIVKLKSGPLGGDQQLGAMIAEEEIDIMIFFWDPMQAQPHDVDVKALLRIATVYNIPMASNRSTADFLISSPLMKEPYHPRLKDYSSYMVRNIDFN